VQAWLRTGRQDAGYMAGAARQAIWRWIVRVWFGRSGPRPGSTVALAAFADDADACAAPEPVETRRGLDEDITAAVWQRLFAARQKRGARGEAATDRDVTILLLVTRGYSNAAIAKTLDIPKDSVKVYRACLRKKLREWSTEECSER
jgi:DNA-binding CsgD family transcriptional regulator